MAEHDMKVLELFEDGFTYKEIADELEISEKQVNHALCRVRTGDEERLPNVEKSNDTFMITSGSRTISISEAKLRLLKEYYCGTKMNINAVCRKLDIPRRDFILIKTAFSIVKDDTPFLDTDLYENDVDDLVNETLEKRKDQYFIKLQETEITSMRKELNKYRQQEYFLEKLHDAVAEHMKEFAKTYTGPVVTEHETNGRNVMLEVAICDLHLGKLCWFPETGVNFDYKIARKAYMEIIDDVYERAKQQNLDKILFVCGSDFFHYDTIHVTTTAGTPQDSDLRWHKLYAIGTQMLVESIHKLATLAPVEVVGIPGNHDKQTVFYAKHYLGGWYKDSDRVTVSDNLKTRTYIEYGKNLIGFSHGDKEGKRIFELMSVEVPSAWARTKYREFHVGHVHHEKADENSGVIVRNLSSVTGTDAWHFERGFVGNVRKCQTFLWDKERGLTEIWHTNIE